MGVGDVSDVAAGQVPDQPAVDGARRQSSGLCSAPSAFDVIQYPGDFRGRKIARERQAGRCAKAVAAALLGHRLEQRFGPHVLPDDRVVDRPAGLRSEEHTSELQSLMRISYAVL